MKNIKIIEVDIDISKILSQLKKHPEDWDSQKKLRGSHSLSDRGFDELPISTLQLIIGGVKSKKDFVGDTDICIETPAYKKHTEIISYLSTKFKKIHRCGFLLLPVGEIVGSHIDEGKYYLSRDRYHLSIQGTYQYFVGNESLIIDPGTLFWFNNKLPHGTVNLGDVPRISFVFDVPHSPNNPQNRV